MCGRYHDNGTACPRRSFFDEEGVLSIKAPPEMVFQLRPSRDSELTWVVKQNPAVSLSFERGEDGKIVSIAAYPGPVAGDAAGGGVATLALGGRLCDHQYPVEAGPVDALA